MLNSDPTNWLAAYLFYNEPWEEFLVKAIEPYVSTVMKTGIADQYFFIRYWDRGPHIRLRFKGEASVLENILKPNLEEHFLNYFDSKPSIRTEPNYPSNFPAKYKWLANNSVQYATYEPEINRYGGAVGVQIAEQHFQASSDFVLKSIKEKGSRWTYDDALGLAIKLHLSFAHSLGMNLDKAKEFFHLIFFSWLPRSFKFYHKKLSKKEYNIQSKETIEQFETAYELQKVELISYHKALWIALENNDDFDDKGLNTWIQKNRLFKTQLSVAQHKKELSPVRLDYRHPTVSDTLVNPKERMLWSIFADFVHMTNNRLGIMNKDEGYLGYLLMRSIYEIRPEKSKVQQLVGV